MKKMSFLGLKELSRSEMKKVMAGSGFTYHRCLNKQICIVGKKTYPCYSPTSSGINCFCQPNTAEKRMCQSNP